MSLHTIITLVKVFTLQRFYYPYILGQEKKYFGSGQLIFENWSGGPLDLFFFFFEPQHKSSKSYFSTSLKT